MPVFGSSLLCFVLHIDKVYNVERQFLIGRGRGSLLVESALPFHIISSNLFTTASMASAEVI